jgi:hypothetical protein
MADVGARMMLIIFKNMGRSDSTSARWGLFQSLLKRVSSLKCFLKPSTKRQPGVNYELPQRRDASRPPTLPTLNPSSCASLHSHRRALEVVLSQELDLTSHDNIKDILSFLRIRMTKIHSKKPSLPLADGRGIQPHSF